MKKAFTLIELLVAVSILAILTAISVISYDGVRLRGRDAQRKNDLNQIKLSLSTYYSAQYPNQYVRSSSDTVPAKITIDGSTDALSTALEPGYMRSVPTDPINSGDNVYKYQSVLNGTLNSGFNLYGTLENKNDKKGWAGGSSWVTDGYVLTNE